MGDEGGGGGGNDAQKEKERQAAANKKAAAEEAANREAVRSKASSSSSSKASSSSSSKTASSAASEDASSSASKEDASSSASMRDRDPSAGVADAGRVSGPPTGETGKIDVNVKRGSGVTATTGVNPNLSTAKQEEFVNPGSEFTGTTTPRPGYTRGMSPGDVNVITGTDLTPEQKANVAGTAGLNVDNFGNLQQRATTDVIQGGAQFIPGASFINAMSKFTATQIRDKIASGGTQVLDTSGKIVGVVEKGDFGDVYTGASGYSPVGTGKKAGATGYVMQESSSIGGGGDGGDGGIASTQTASTATNVTGSTTSLSTAARRQALQGGAGGASRRRFIG